ncbi:MAG TPA: helicase-related protein, partial [Plasticicumulans sp.]|nr:helicase-related protein [Plasticicumulans sp.]
MSPELPITAVLPALAQTLAAAPAVVLQAPPGAGKSTGVPLALLDAPWLAGRRIVMLEPRRLAARAVAARMSALLGEPPGATVGYRVRFEARVSARTRIEVVTEGILTRRLQSDPELAGVGLLIFDEFHERSLHADLALALARDAQLGLREDLKLLLMSATLDGERLCRLLDDAPLVSSEGRAHPVAIRHVAREPEAPLPEALAQQVVRLLAEESGDVLAFLPGGAEIRRAAERLRTLAPQVSVLPLYGEPPAAEQQRALEPAPDGRRRVVLATTIAETSLTIDGIRLVVDGGWTGAP